jgi:glycosyltransferase involved in cell wall biosynthesis
VTHNGQILDPAGRRPNDAPGGGASSAGSQPADDLVVLIVSEHASARFGGEAALPLHYFRVLRRRGFDVWLISHARTRDELTQLFPGDRRILYVEDTALHRLMYRMSRRLPLELANFTSGFVSRFAVQLQQRRLAKRLISERGINIVHQPMPVSPREPSMMYGLGVPVIIGPMNGGMDYPPAFRSHRKTVVRLFISLARWSSHILNWAVPGKRRAALLLVANARTRAALPPGVCPRVVELVENGVDLSLWRPVPASRSSASATLPPTFAFVGRLVDWKAVDILLQAFHLASRRAAMRLLIIGDGDERGALQKLAMELGILATTRDRAGGVFFAGWLSQQQCADELRHADCLVLTSLRECGGAVVLEAMSLGKPVIVTSWGGPADYVDATCGVLVEPADRHALVQGFADAMVRLASSQELREQMGQRGRNKVLREYDWEVKVDRMVQLYRQASEVGAIGNP